MPLSLDAGSYGLRQATSSDKTVLLMKLTDTALRIIESYQDNSNHVRAKPIIQFQGNQGFIHIPVPGGGDQEMQKFSFQVSNLAQSAGDCLQQIRSGGTGRVECLGSIQQKVTVNATDDSYDMTRQRMTQAKKEEQKASTKVIKQPGSKMGKAYKKTGKGRIMEKSSKRLSPDTRAPTPPISRLTPTMMGRSSSPLTIPNKDNGSSPSAAPGSGRNKTKPIITLSSSSSSALKNSTPQTNSVPSASAVAARPLWDRVAHLLAVRPYKYPEIVIRLSRDKPPDKARLQEILSKVASTRNSSGGGTEYCLLRNNYNSLEVDTWPGYTENERKTAKKKQSEMTGTGDNRKRSYTNTLSPPESANESLVEEEYSNPTSKKQRVSHLKGRTSGASSPFEPDKPKSRSPVAPKSTGISFGTARLPSEGPKKQSPPKRDFHNHREERPNANSHNNKAFSNKSSTPKIFKPEEPPQRQQEEEEDFLKRYTPISNVEQRDRYKKDFYAEYQEYLCHHSNVAAVSGRFAELQRKLNEHEKGSDEYKAISKQVIQEYKKTKKNDAYHRERARMQFLHRKLQHIKDLVSTFDRHKLASRADNEPGLCMPTKSVTKVA